MNISDIIHPGTSFFGLAVPDREACLQTLADSMEEAGFVGNKTAYVAAVNAREEKGSTGIGFGVAIPHGKSSAVNTAGLAFARLAAPIEWNSLDGQPVQAVFLIGVPEKDTGNEHMKILIALSRKLIHQEFRDKLLAINSFTGLQQLLQTL